MVKGPVDKWCARMAGRKAGAARAQSEARISLHLLDHVQDVGFGNHWRVLLIGCKRLILSAAWKVGGAQGGLR